MSGSPRFKQGVPGVPPAAGADDTAAAFIAGAPRKDVLPWQMPVARSTVRTYINTSQPMVITQQLDWLAHHTGRTKRDLIEAALREYLQRELPRAGADPDIHDR